MPDEMRAVEYGDDEKFAVKQMEDLQTQLDNEDDEVQAYTVSDYITDESAILSDMNLRLERIEKTVNGLRDGVNTIGQMMNGVADAFGQVMEQVQKGGIGALLGGMMGGNKNG